MQYDYACMYTWSIINAQRERECLHPLDAHIHATGLDAASSTELLTHLNALAASNRTVVLTIHQPRLEIFHMFHRILVLSDGKVHVHVCQNLIPQLPIIY